jgi:hypothetical protein
MRNQRVAKSSIAFFFLMSVIQTEFSLCQLQGSSRSALMTQADYVIITPLRYVSTMQPLAAFRQVRNGFTVATITTEDIYNIFGQGIPPDSAIRDFIAFTLSGGWMDPKPQYFLLAGNVNAVPSHKEPGMILPPTIYEDSVHIDQWLVEGVPDTTFPRPVVAIGRFPAVDSTGLAAMVTKTIAYESSTDTSWVGRTLIAADYDTDVGYLFEQVAQTMQQHLAPIWRDTLTAHVRQSSPMHRTKQQFRSVWNQGVAIVSLLGLANWMQFSRSAYFTTWDVDSLADHSPAAFFTMESDQRFERSDTLAIASSLLAAEHKGAVATLAPCGLIFASINQNFFGAVFQEMVNNPNRPIGKILLDVKRASSERIYLRRQTLLGDPALVVKSPLVTGVVHPPAVPSKFVLYQNYPNPFNPTTTIVFSIPRRSTVSVKVFDLLGRELETLLSGQLEAGTFSVQWNAQNASSGVYFYKLQADGYVETKRMLLLK